jgi:hypothetical protein
MGIILFKTLNPEDRRLAEKFLQRLHYISLDEKLTFDEKIDKVIETRMREVKNEFPSKASEVHKKYLIRASGCML